MFQILVVEDDKNVRRLMSAVLTRYGYEPIPAGDGVEALEMSSTAVTGMPRVEMAAAVRPGAYRLRPRSKNLRAMPRIS